MKKYLNLFDFSQKVDYKIEILSGLTVAMALIPEAVAFALIAGLSPLTGLYAAFMMGLVTSILGGRPGMISGATGAIAVVLVTLAASHGVEYIFATVILAGILQIAAGTLRLGKLMRLVPHPVIFGFVNGLAIIIFMSQLDQFKGEDGNWLSGSTLYILLGLVLLTMLIIWGLPKLTKAIPASLTAILSVFAIVTFLDIDTKTVGDIASIKGGFPPFHIPSIPFTWETLQLIFPYAAIVAGVGLIESLLTLNIIDEITETRGRGNKEAVAQGTANILSGFFSGMGGCAMIGQSLINVSSGARARLSGIVASIMLLVFIMFGSSLIEQVPMAALTGLMIMVSIGTFEWASLRTFTKMPKSDVFLMVLVTLVTAVLHNLALAVLIGVILAALFFAWDNAKRIRARKRIDENGVKHYEMYGPLFFGSISAFNDKFDVLNDPEEVIIDFKESRIVDMSAIEALNKITERYLKVGKRVHLRHLSPDCRRLIDKADSIIDVNVMEDPTYKVAVDQL
ncbi:MULTISPECIES: SulP family inorganic anion transporter [unclassified Algoriphagus]|jgi:SulP family sulfate permease|uniref:SulP family inorganic anion transporter n=2 Tax=Algoriphagus TaxID=246875 RepID=UPI000C8D7DA5|nr:MULTISPECIES: SulP family inorganic anion transporter [unclassified Algoriphagus]MAN88940.1 sodium-independent anion transporter [Algoriphagus sp.]QYH39562.1 SulP family inorganic anion transporter [Algoriphagus sp. NBT04N3]HAH36404.1 sodium-independent anion transporter [Algoriphagus sp.]HAS56905.1 sodium-independent anion transporter [Algoriphagus sp.]HCH45548.1 sodium-independent anion transporter [Algoriphagus sp.]|tara:strand:+ start:3296 stop:4825 length:1530 start_codon:yes stop_codon:yes gene_type:complete